MKGEERVKDEGQIKKDEGVINKGVVEGDKA